jgi:Arc/MetJ-type ribon-helix-helix transcriptional regulator
MEISIRPEVEAMMREAVRLGSYRSLDEFVERAVALLHEQETWLAEHRSEIESQIAAGYESAQRGNLIGADEVRTRLSQSKQTRTGPSPR